MSNQPENTSEQGGCLHVAIGLIAVFIIIGIITFFFGGGDDNKLEFKPTGDAKRDSLEKLRVDLHNRYFSFEERDALMKMTRSAVYRSLAADRKRLTEFPKNWNGSIWTRFVERKGDVLIATYAIQYPIKYAEIGVGVEIKTDVVVVLSLNSFTDKWTITSIYYVE